MYPSVSYRRYDIGLPLKLFYRTCCWSPTTQFLAIPSLTEVVLFNNLTWTKTTSFSPLVNEANIVYEEHGPKFHLSQTNFNKYLENPEPTEITRAKFSPTNKYLAAIQGRSIQVSKQKTIWLRSSWVNWNIIQIYKIESLKLVSVIFLKSDVKAVEWSPIKDELLATANNSNVSFFISKTSLKAHVGQIPKFPVMRL